jgi:hypothetical protein
VKKQIMSLKEIGLNFKRRTGTQIRHKERIKMQTKQIGSA